MEVPVNTMWMLAIALKSLVQAVQTHSADSLGSLFESVFVRSVSYLAMRGTEFSRHWIITDLEVCHFPVCSLVLCFAL